MAQHASVLVVPMLLSLASAQADDWPQYRGPNRDDVSAERGLLNPWPAAGPPLAWTYKNAGVGYSSCAIVGDRLYTIGGRGDDEFLFALDLKTIKDGEPVEAWALKVGPTFKFKTNQWTSGPSATPTVDGPFIFALGGNGDLVCAESATGKEVWRKNLPKDMDAQVNPIGGGPKNLGWGFTWSPLVAGDRLICLPGGPKGTVAALEKSSGKILWRSTEMMDQAAYTSPVQATIHGIQQFVVLTNFGLAGVSASDGRLLWRYRRTPPYGTEVVNSPIVVGSRILATVGAGQGCDLIEIKRDGEKLSAEKVYANKNLANHHGNVILREGHVYGFSEGKGWICLNFDSGQMVWEEKRRFRAGSMVFADGRFICFGEDDGMVVQVAATTEGWKESGRFKVPHQTKLRQPRGRIWTPPMIAHGKLYLRDQDLIFCYDLKPR